MYWVKPKTQTTLKLDSGVTGGGEFESEVRSQLANYPNQANQPIFDYIEVDNIEHFYKKIQILCVRGFPRAISSILIRTTVSLYAANFNRKEH